MESCSSLGTTCNPERTDLGELVKENWKVETEYLQRERILAAGVMVNYISEELGLG